MKETLQERIRRFTFVRDCIDVTNEAGRMEYEWLDKYIEEMKQSSI